MPSAGAVNNSLISVNWRTRAAAGKLTFHLFASLAEFERDILRQRVNAGLKAARRRGCVGGRPKSLNDDDLKKARALLRSGGATLPLMMSFVGAREANRAGSFGFLYLANVMGASAGTVITALVLVETFGFRETYVIAATINFVIAATSFALARACGARSDEPALAAHVPTRPASPTLRWSELVLFTTGFTSLAMEVVWTRAFTFVLKTTIYAFASIIGTYLVATWIGSYLIPEISPAEFVARLPASARRDLMEWNTDMTIEKMVEYSCRDEPRSSSCCRPAPT